MGRTDGRAGGRTDGRAGGRTDGRTNERAGGTNWFVETVINLLTNSLRSSFLIYCRRSSIQKSREKWPKLKLVNNVR